MLKVGDFLTSDASSVSASIRLANSHEFLNLSGHIVIAWMWLRQETAALAGLHLAGVSDADAHFYEGKRRASAFFFAHELPKTDAQARLLMSLDDSVLTMPDVCF